MRKNNLLTRRLDSLRVLYNEYPSQFWVLIAGTFIDRLGGALLFPFFTLYITQKFDVGMIQVGVIFGIFSLTSVAGSMVGGALSDRLGRKGMVLFGLIASALSSLVMGVVNDLALFYGVVVVVGLLTNVAGPAQQAMVADLLPEQQRSEGFGLLRVVVNLAVVIGPMIGGLLAARSYLLLFVLDAVSSLITAVIVYAVLQETRPEGDEAEEAETMGQTLAGYGTVLRDLAFVWFLLASVLMVLVYMQMNTTLAVFLRDVHGVPEQGFGYIMSLNAAMVVLLQFPISRRISEHRPLLIMTAGSILYAAGFALYGFVSTFLMFLIAMAIITVGEMFVSPVGQAIVARLAPQQMRGRYMAIYGFSWVIPSAIGPLLAGIVMDNYDPRWVWYGAGLVGIAAAVAFYLLEWRVGRETWTAVDRRLQIMQALETGRLTARQAAQQLERVDGGQLASLATASGAAASSSRCLRIRVSELGGGVMKTDLQLPVGLVNTVLYAGGILDADLEHVDAQLLHNLIARSLAEEGKHTLDTDAERIEVSIK
jgi:MFS family permease